MSAVASVIADHPPNDGREWDCQCARCGSSCGFEDCSDCGGDGYTWEDDDDTGVEYEDPCRVCHGRGGWDYCLSDADWCEAHPLPGREQVTRGTIEWFTFEEADHG